MQSQAQAPQEGAREQRNEPTEAAAAKPREVEAACAPELADAGALRGFVGEIRRSFSHDLRTPLGTIVNYATMLETGGAVPAEEVQSFARNIRRNAMRAANMLEHVGAAAMLASRSPSREEIDLRGLLERALLVVGSDAKVRSTEENGGALSANVDAALFGFVWTSYLALEADAAGAPPSSVELSVDPHGGSLSVTVAVGKAQSTPQPVVELSRYLAEAGESARPESRHAFRLAAQTVGLHGGSLELCGRAGAGSSLRLSFAHAS